MRVLVFAKAPVAGEAKTRLMPALGADGAARLAERLTMQTFDMLSASGLGPIELWCAPDVRHPLFTQAAGRHGWALHPQRGRDLGERLWSAASHLPGGLLMLGTDCPALTGDHLRQALACLSSQDAVLGPAEDGGYVLLGLRRAHASLFTDMPWSSDQVAAITRERLRRLGWTWSELAPLPDIDRPEDLARLPDALRDSLAGSAWQSGQHASCSRS
ncbi:TIGR04282 family arsenosugar biosynthesis glycosyltransferase [Thiohalocapsa marina]|uniref:TIGR04282 family arsenosugar biosynthesis glycosyltransferase n=1 Tax=Thiohalocapsa marina TaxID=424902 RepID=UPI0036D773E8